MSPPQHQAARECRVCISAIVLALWLGDMFLFILQVFLVSLNQIGCESDAFDMFAVFFNLNSFAEYCYRWLLCFFNNCIPFLLYIYLLVLKWLD